jgi:hypothetical protein
MHARRLQGDHRAGCGDRPREPVINRGSAAPKSCPVPVGRLPVIEQNQPARAAFVQVFQVCFTPNTDHAFAGLVPRRVEMRCTGSDESGRSVCRYRLGSGGGGPVASGSLSSCCRCLAIWWRVWQLAIAPNMARPGTPPATAPLRQSFASAGIVAVEIARTSGLGAY